MTRVDLFTTIHKGVRALLFEAARQTAQVDVTSNFAVDALAERIERMLCLTAEHARHEDTEILPLIRSVDPEVATSMGAEHDALHAAEHDVERAVRRLSLAAPEQRELHGKELLRLVNLLTAKHLLHMNREETLGNAVLWGAFGDPALRAVRTSIFGNLQRGHRAEWVEVLAPVASPEDLALLFR